ncbi:HxlR family transcriptional regulator [Jatrophihabitans sp. GAS493]|uniref:winged helix-turn-helix transcriptional regulator n=1 Tax=Jatrophihabitans sp. GAS493 TaxID=1907575 RepID=UPI000BB6C281|nr:helix-turn-helix domain-containing protein [Jatrophihabitans sp. GAS493]SOD70808.1 HxlR family transcriptional regulator [Jatrophihabitans sp. GAS493]
MSGTTEIHQLPTLPATPEPYVRECTIADALAVIGDRWSLLAIREMFYGVHRFNDIARNTGAPRDILTSRLRKLVDTGVLTREQYSERPARFEYQLTDAGRALSPVLLTLKEWGDTYLIEGVPPVRYRHSCGSELHAVVTCQNCEQPLADRSLRLIRD